ncbi:Mur ligase domain-containing protein [Actinocorallia sp. API 0066]|uniref:UDP-N-acetylmuramate--L-alanine ligase n=1 Tax=Actinocorallia sp. API 0066 TaxID=2896846 RepID=UPI001E390415|nr:Mur ligase family protein [Actinocorallia sp. API 0066]MCD0448867.1 Mur ligase domain-containing protein [Actinocorallia sp. API 0066]
MSDARRTGWPGGSPPVAQNVDMARPHLIGAAGTGMWPLGVFLRAAGHTVSGSDLAWSGHDTENVEGASCVVYSTAVDAMNPLLAAARRRGVPAVHRAQALDLALDALNWTGVSGTHGKTSTTAMLAHILRETGADPSWIVGGRPSGMAAAHCGGGLAGVAEVDESDRSMLLTRPFFALVTNLDDDHTENYGGGSGLLDTVEAWARRANSVVVCADDVGGSALATALRLGRSRVLTYGTGGDTDVTIKETRSLRDATAVTLGDGVRFLLPVPGPEQALNSVGAIAAASLYGIDTSAAAEALETFAGVERRLTVTPLAGDVAVLDSYAHHPTAIAADLAVAAASGRVVLAFQPSGHERIVRLAERIADATRAADELVLLPPHSHRDTPTDHLVAYLRRHHPRLTVVADAAEATARLAELARPGDTIVTMGTGDVAGLTPRLLLAKRASATT